MHDEVFAERNRETAVSDRFLRGFGALQSSRKQKVHDEIAGGKLAVDERARRETESILQPESTDAKLPLKSILTTMGSTSSAPEIILP
jgi:hypothetical protein